MDRQRHRGRIVLLSIICVVLGAVACGDSLRPACGDGVAREDQICNDGNASNGDGCDNNCTVTACGNGIRVGAEACDDGNLIDGDGCDSNCKATACGNGAVSSGEACDDGNLIDGDGCDHNCTLTGCGNGIEVDAEQCDDGNTTDGDGCDSNCKVTACGNGVRTGVEACDDGNLVDGDGCDHNCSLTACGNGITTGNEACDDGNAINGDGCDSNCTIPGCGNRIVAGTEQCDDGNLADGDGCDNNCTTTACGNGITTTGEQCDDHNAIDGDGCDNRCVFEPGTPGQCALVRAEWETLLAQPQAMCAHATPNDIPADFAPSLYTLEFQRIVPELANEYPGFAMETWNRLTAWGYLNACGPQGPELWFSTQMTWLLAGESPLRAFVLGLDFTNDPTMPVDPVRPWKSSRFRPPMRVYDSIISFEPTSFSFYVLEKGIARYGVAASSSQYCQ